jgi:hypothetical protein
MKKLILFTLFILCTGSYVLAGGMPADTTVNFNRKMVKVEDNADQIKVKVYERATNDTVPYRQLYEGIFSDGKSYERWTVMDAIGIELPLFNKRSDKASRKNRQYWMEPHWAGFGIGFANITDHSLNMTSVNGLAVKPDQTTEWFINLIEHILPIYRNTFGITTGLGMSWHTFRLDNNTHLVDMNGVTGVYDAPAGITYEYSRLKVVHLTFPVLLEWQPAFGRNHKAFVSAGVVGGLKTYSSFKVKYVDHDGNTVKKVEDKGLNTRPLTLDLMAQAGYGDISVYAKYSPISIFLDNKGPDVRAASLGLILHF